MRGGSDWIPGLLKAGASELAVQAQKGKKETDGADDNSVDEPVLPRVVEPDKHANDYADDDDRRTCEHVSQATLPSSAGAVFRR